MGLFLGLDLGSTGIRGIVIDSDEGLLTSIQESIPKDLLYEGCRDTLQGRHEQNPWSWIEQAYELLRGIVENIKQHGKSLDEVEGICSDSTSGTILAVDEFGTPLTSAIMYNDIRAQREVQRSNAVLNVRFDRDQTYPLPATGGTGPSTWLGRNRYTRH